MRNVYKQREFLVVLRDKDQNRTWMFWFDRVKEEDVTVFVCKENKNRAVRRHEGGGPDLLLLGFTCFLGLLIHLSPIPFSLMRTSDSSECISLAVNILFGPSI